MSQLVLQGTYTASTQEILDSILPSIEAMPGVFNIQVNGLVITFQVDRTE